MSWRWQVGRSRAQAVHFGNVDADVCEAAFGAAVIEAVAEMDFQCDGQVAGAYQIAA